MENIKKVSLIPIFAMAIISFIGVFGINIGGDCRLLLGG